MNKAEQSKPQQKAVKAKTTLNWQETAFRISDIFTKINFPKWNVPQMNVPQIKPLYDYGLHLQEIQTRFTTPEIVKSIQSLNDWRNEIETAKTKAEANLWYNLAVEDYEFEKSRDKDKITELEIKNAEAYQRILEQEIAIKTMLRLSNTQPTKQQQAKPTTLKPNVTQSQIVRLYEATKGIFEATAEQWRAVFSETEIQLSEPIQAVAVADIAVLFYYLKEREFIETSKYPSIIERTKAFSINVKTVTAKQLNKSKSENYNFPHTGKNYIKIEKVVRSL
jgi:hypothetical protein